MQVTQYVWFSFLMLKLGLNFLQIYSKNIFMANMCVCSKIIYAKLEPNLSDLE